MSFPTREQVLALIEEHAPQRLRQVLADNLRPAIGIETHEAEDASIAIGASKIGGAPDVPLGFVWPEWKGKPLGFVAQFNVEEVAASDVEHALPDSGTLSFFYAIEKQPWGFAGDEGAWQVLWWPRGVALERRSLPFEATRRNSLPAHALEFAVEWTVPDTNAAVLVDVEPDDAEWEAYPDWLERLGSGTSGKSRHRLLGYADPVQDDVPLYAFLKAHNLKLPQDNPGFWEQMQRGEGGQWRLLFQLDSQFDRQTRKAKWCWGDGGMIYFCIHRDDLAARRFDKVWLQLQCS